MHVLFDVSSLGLPQILKKGVYRVVDNIARQLMTTQECDMRFGVGLSLSTLKYALEAIRGDSLLSLSPIAYPRTPLLYKRLLEGLYWKVCADGIVAQWLSRRLQALEDRFCGRSIPRAAFRDVDIFHLPYVYCSIPNEILRYRHLHIFVTVHDLIPILHPEYVGNIVTGENLKKGLHALTARGWFFTVSEATKADLLSYLPIDPCRVFVTPLAVDNEVFYQKNDPQGNECRIRRYGIPDRKYILAMTGFDYRKNIDFLMQCFGAIIRQEDINDLSLVIVGPDKKTGECLARAMKKGYLNTRMLRHILCINYVDDNDMALLYQEALMFCFPSLYEGFGLPALEAMQCGTPAIVSNVASLPEVVGNACMMLSPVDNDGWCQAMLELYDNEITRQKFISKGFKQAKKFSWQKHRDAIISGYRTALG